MIQDGIYEQIVNTRLQAELDVLDLSQYDIELDCLLADDARKILTIYISYIIQRGLHYVRDNYANSEEQAALIESRLNSVLSSRSWRLTRPLRWITRQMQQSTE